MEHGAAKSFQDLVVWQKSHALALRLYRSSSRYPKSEASGLTSQVRRAATSVPANIAEGFKRDGKADKARTLKVARLLDAYRNRILSSIRQSRLPAF